MNGKWIKERREQLGLNQEQLAARLQLHGLDVTRATVSHWETGRHHSPLDEVSALKALADALEVSLDVLLAEVGSTSSDSLTPQERKIIGALRRGDKMEAIRIISGS